MLPTPGPLELVIILVIALLILGPGKLPDVGRRPREEHQGIPQGVLGRAGGGDRQRRYVAHACRDTGRRAAGRPPDARSGCRARRRR